MYDEGIDANAAFDNGRGKFEGTMGGSLAFDPFVGMTGVWCHFQYGCVFGHAVLVDVFVDVCVICVLLQYPPIILEILSSYSLVSSFDFFSKTTEFEAMDVLGERVQWTVLRFV